MSATSHLNKKMHVLGGMREYVAMRGKRVVRNRIVAVLALIAAAATTIALVQPATTLAYVCGMEEHVHTESCYENVLVCGQEEGEDHVHANECYEKQLVCDKVEHAHTDACRAVEDQPSNEGAFEEEAPQAPSEAVVPEPEAGQVDAPAPVALTFDGPVAVYAPSRHAAMVPTRDAVTAVTGLAHTGSGADITITTPKQDEILVWNFEPQGNGTYKAWTMVGGQRRYLSISGGFFGGNVSLGSTGSDLTVSGTPGAYEISVQGSSILGGKKTYYLVFSGGEFAASTTKGTVALVDAAHVKLPEPPKPVEGVTPAGTVINLFDYTVSRPVSQETPQNTEGQPSGPVNNNNPANDPFYNKGINDGMSLKFSNAGMGNTGTLNRWTSWQEGAGGVLQEIVSDGLVNGYPTIKGGKRGGKAGESLAYLFDPDNHAKDTYRAAHTNVGGLLQLDPQGYYYYDSTKNFAEYKKDSNSFKLYEKVAVSDGGGSANVGQFFPFNTLEDGKIDETTGSDSNLLNHFFGMSLTTRFMQQNGGYVDTAQTRPTTFEFSGDDDVWIYVNGHLLGDLGGIHGAEGVTIDFAKGTVAYTNIYHGRWESTPAKTKRFSDYLPADMLDSKGTLKSGKYYTLNFFYLERGGNSSNLKLKYNLKSIPATGIYKVDQFGKAVPGAAFGIYRATKDFAYADDPSVEHNAPVDANGLVGGKVKPMASATTDSAGRFVFKDEYGGPLSLGDIEEQFGSHAILREYGVPSGYRKPSHEIHVKITTHKNGQKTLTCENPYESGTYAAANVLIGAPGTLYKADGTKVEYYTPGKEDEHGMLFGVVLKREADGWHPVAGSPETGFTSLDSAPGEQFVETALRAARRNNELKRNPIFSMGASGAMELSMENLPGDIDEYLYGGAPEDTARFLVAYYHTTASSLDQANASNTYRVISGSHDGGSASVPANYTFDRVFGSTITIPDIKNRIMVKKVDEESKKPVNGARFGLYEVAEVSGRVYYVASDGSKVRLDADADRDGEGSASILNGKSGLHYVVDPKTGVITVGDTVSIKPHLEPKETARVEAGIGSGDSNTGSAEEGSLVFEGVKPGRFALREISAPAGYAINPHEILVFVNSTEVLANAGTAKDGVRVGRGAGHIVNSMARFASDGEVDKTLNWIVGRLRVSDVDAGFDALSKGVATWKYAADEKGAKAKGPKDAMRNYLIYSDHNDLDYNVDTNGRGVGADYGTGAVVEATQLYTNQGWSMPAVWQDYAFGSKHVDTSTCTYRDLSDPAIYGGDDISQLFSRSITIEVADQRASSLKVTKTVVDEKGEGDPNREFSFKVSLAHGQAGAEPLTGPFACRVFAKDGTRRELLVLTDATNTVTLKNGESFEIVSIPKGASYQVEEVSAPGYAPSYAVDGGEARPGTTTGWQDLVWDSSSARYGSVVAYTNTLANTVSVALHKTDASGNVNLDGARFVLFKGEGATREYWVASNGSWKRPGTSPESEFAFDLGSLQVANLDQGCAYYLKELKAPQGYVLLEKPITFTVSNGTITAGYTDGTPLDSKFVDGLTLKIPNNPGEALPETGGSGRGAALAAGITILAACGAVGILRKRACEKGARG